MAVDVVVPASHRLDGSDTATPAFAFPISTLVPASAAICIAASAYVSTLLSYYATFAASLVCLARAAWPDRVDAALARAGAYARRKLSLARADLEADLRHLRDAARGNAAAAQVYARAEECARRARATVAGWAGRARSRAEAKWDQHRNAARAARFVLRLVALAARLAATVLFDAACDEARACAPAVLGYLRGVVDAIRPPPSPSCDEGEDEAAAGFALKDVACLVGAGFYLLFTVHLLFSSSAASGMQFCAVCFAATCGLTMLIADWIDPPDDADETDTTATTAYHGSPKGDDAAGEAASRDEELEVRESWRFLWVLVVITHCIDVFLLRVTLGPQPMTLAILALCNLEVLKVGREVQLTPDDGGEGAAAAEGSAQVQGVDGAAVDKWRRGAMVVYAACSVKTFVVYLVLDWYLAALGFLWLFVMADLLLAEEDNLSDFDDASGEEDDEDGEEESPGFEGNMNGGGEGELDEEAREGHSNTSSSEDEAESSVHCDSSKELEIVDDEHRQEEGPDYGSGGSSDDSWDLVDVDPEMPAEANCGAKRRKSRPIPRRKHMKHADSWDLVDVDPEMPAEASSGAKRMKSRPIPRMKHMRKHAA